ncbi:hypothetical protein V2A60_002290 [Cordyceps javanica]
MAAIHGNGPLPSSKWLSFDGWDYNGMKERLEDAVRTINKASLIDHAVHVTGQRMRMSEPFSAGQYWICFELVAEDGSLVIARVRLPRHPEAPPTVTEQDMAYATDCEIATTRYVRSKLTTITIPRVHAYEPADSPRAKEVGAAYMLIEGFRGNSLLDVEYDMTHLAPPVQEQITTQWTRVQAELATLALPQIGSISSLSPTEEPVIGRIASAAGEGFQDAGPFNRSVDYFAAAGQAAVARQKAAAVSADGQGQGLPFAAIGALVFCDIVSRTALFQDMGVKGSFPLNHMDLGTQNIIVDDEFRVLAAIDWEFAQTAPWQVNHYPMPFPPLGSQRRTESILADPSHIAHKNVMRHESARKMYRAGFRMAEEELREQGRPIPESLARVLDCTASRIYACFTKLGRILDEDEELVQRMVRMAFGWDDAKTKSYIADMEAVLWTPASSEATFSG